METKFADRKSFNKLDKEGSGLLIKLILAESQDLKDPEDGKLPFLSEIVQKRIDALKLPIKFTYKAFLAVGIFADRPGSAVIFLIDALNKFEGQEVTVSKICESLYPWGFYTEEKIGDYIDNKIRKKQVKWHEIY